MATCHSLQTSCPIAQARDLVEMAFKFPEQSVVGHLPVSSLAKEILGKGTVNNGGEMGVRWVQPTPCVIPEGGDITVPPPWDARRGQHPPGTLP